MRGAFITRIPVIKSQIPNPKSQIPNPKSRRATEVHRLSATRWGRETDSWGLDERERRAHRDVLRNERSYEHNGVVRSAERACSWRGSRHSCATY